MQPTFSKYLIALKNFGCNPKINGDSYSAFCPVHESDGQGHKPSLTIKTGEKQSVILHCHAGCSFESITAALGLDRKPDPQRPKNGARQPIAVYSYHDPSGVEVRQKLRFEPKNFQIRHQGADGAWVYKAGTGPAVMYRLPSILAAIAKGETIFVCEGEKDADRLAGLELTTTCNIEGAAQPGQKSKWRPNYTKQLTGATRVVLLPDNDDPGRAHMKAIAAALRGKVGAVVTLELPGLPPKGDVSDWLNQGHTADELRALADSKILESTIVESAFSDKSESSAVFDTDDPRLLRNKRGGIQKNISNAILVAENLIPGLIGYNEFRQRIEARIPTPWRKVSGAWTDWDTGELADLSARRGFPDFSSEKLNAAIMVTAHRNPFNPAQDRLRALSEQWDGVNRLDSWLTEYLHAETTPDNADYLKEIGAAWMKGTAARVQIPGCKRDDVLVLRGPQGWFKSTAAQAIADAIAPDAFTDSLGNLESKDAKAGIRGIVIAELGELAALSKSSVESIKAFVATRSDHFREAYGKLERDFPRTVSFIGTTNDERFLKDPTGNRRWWPVTLTRPIDIERFRAALPQLLGEAARRVLDGEAWHVSNRAALQQAEIIRADCYDHDVWTDAVLSAADALATAEGHATVAGILEKMRIPAHLQTTGAQMRVGGILRIAAWNSKRRRVNGRLLVAWSPAGSVHPLDRVNSKGEQVLACETADVHPVHPVHPSWSEVKKTEGERDDSSTERQGDANAKYSPYTETGCTGVNRVNTPSNSGDSAVHPCCSPYPKGEQTCLNPPPNTGFQQLSNDAKRLWSEVLGLYQGWETIPRLARKSGLDVTRTNLALADLAKHGLAEITDDSAKPIHPGG